MPKAKELFCRTCYYYIRSCVHPKVPKKLKKLKKKGTKACAQYKAY